MEFDKVLDKKLKRNKFFITVGTAATAYFVMKTFPFSYLFKKRNTSKQIVPVKLNPYAVSREKTKVDNVRQ
jgi:hypothetical protein